MSRARLTVATPSTPPAAPDLEEVGSQLDGAAAVFWLLGQLREQAVFPGMSRGTDLIPSGTVFADAATDGLTVGEASEWLTDVCLLTLNDALAEMRKALKPGAQA